MTRRRTIDGSLLSRMLMGEAPLPKGNVQNAGSLKASYEDPPSPETPGRWQTLLVYGDKWLVLVDEFRAPRPTPFALSITQSHPRKKGRPFHWRHGKHPFTLHPLGDYLFEQTTRAWTWSQRLLLGRFLLVLTRHPDVSVRTTHGWAIEIRTQDRIHLIMHSNRSRRLRPLGPIKTDARFALVEVGQAFQPDLETPPFTTPLCLIGAHNLHWTDKTQLTFDAPANLVHEPKTP